MSVKITFLGAAGTVTGSKYLVETTSGDKILVDAGMFQGAREWRERNWLEHDIPFKDIKAVLITHAHIDHTGILPRFFKLGLNCPVYATAPTLSLSEVLLTDSARLQEEEAAFRAKHGKSRHQPPLPLYTLQDAKTALDNFRAVPFGAEVEVVPGVKARWSRMGHILGAASIELNLGSRTINFSGDIGRYNVPILRDPEPVKLNDLLLIEATYGNRLHDAGNPKIKLAQVINETVNRGGVVVIPAFAVGRTQLILYYLRELKEEGRIPDIPIIVDSPMAHDATDLYKKYPDDYDSAALGVLNHGRQPFSPEKLHFVKDRQESIKLNSIVDPMVIISASGMLSGGRVLHHLLHRISSPLNSVLFVGYQPPGGRGAWIKSGADTCRILGDEIPIRATIDEVSGLSAHGDRDELLRWCKSCSGAPGKVAIVHSEPDSAEDFKKSLASEFSWNVEVAKYLETWEV